MYERKIVKAKNRVLENGKIHFGTFDSVPENIDIRGLRKPFGLLPLPIFSTNTRVRSSVAFKFSTEKFLGFFQIFNTRFLTYGEFVLFDTQNKQRYIVRKFSFNFKRIISFSTKTGGCVFFRHNFHVRINWTGEKLNVFMRFNQYKMPVALHFTCERHSEEVGEISACLPEKVMRRCRVFHQIGGRFLGKVKVGSETDSAATALCFFETRHAYYELLFNKRNICGFGVVGEKSLMFSLSQSSLDSADRYEFNDNTLTVDGKVFCLPPVKMTAEYGLEKKWVIQDTENMVDLTFTPDQKSKYGLSAIIFHLDSSILAGTFEGAFFLKDGESITIKDLPGLGYNVRLRL